MAKDKLIYASDARRAILKEDPKLAYCIDEIPGVDAVEVPCRCKDCKYWKHFAHVGCSDFAKVCTLANYMIGATGYCLYGERKNEDGK